MGDPNARQQSTSTSTGRPTRGFLRDTRPEGHASQGWRRRPGLGRDGPRNRGARGWQAAHSQQHRSDGAETLTRGALEDRSHPRVVTQDHIEPVSLTSGTRRFFHPDGERTRAFGRSARAGVGAPCTRRRARCQSASWARAARGPLRRAHHPACRCTVSLWTLTLVSRLERRGPPARAYSVFRRASPHPLRSATTT